ncbi:MAG: hypothetical protein H0V05_18020 [Euzebyaceae bacterium]|nr:hypothetical protein [Euzebyaceae bacterium]
MGVRPGAEIDRRIIDAYTRMPQGGEYDVDEWGDLGAVVVLTRDAAIPVLKRVTVATITRHIRGLPTEVVLDEDDGMPARCAVSR